MKKAATIICLFFLVTPWCYSQKSFGVKAGANLATLAVNEAYSIQPKNRLGYHLGIWKEFTLTPKLFLRPELFYTQKGFRYSDTITSPVTNALIRRKGTIIYNYLTLSLLIGYRATDKISLYLGPEVSALVAARGRSKGEEASNMRLLMNYDNLDVGLTTGIMYKLTSRINADLRYTYGFSTVLNYDVTDTQGQYEYTLKQSHNKAAQLGLGYTLKNKD